MPIVQAGSINTTSLVVPDLYVQIVPPQNLVINGVPTNVLGVVGTAQWGPVGSPVICSSMADYARNFGAVQARKYDMGTHVATAVQQGASNFRCVRASDGTDTAAAFQIPGTTVVLTAAYTGSLGSQIALSIGAGSKSGSWRATIALPGIVPEVFDNLTNAFYASAITAGSGYSAPPPIAFPVPTLPGGVQAQGNLTLKAVTASVVAGHAGTGFVTGDTVVLPGNVAATVTAAAGAVTALAISGTQPGYVTATAPANPVSQVSTSGAGTGLQVNLSWGLQSINFTTQGSGYAGTEANPTISTGYGTGGSVTGAYSIWPNFINAINNGNGPQRLPSQIVVASGIGYSVPTAGSYVFASGTPGTDGAGAVTAATLIGADTTPRKGMYALRGQGCSIGVLADADDSTQWTTQAAFGLAEGIYMILCGPSGDTISNAVSTKATAGLDTYACKLMFGDWLWWNDQTNAALRLVSPQGFVAGRLANLSPQNSSLNKPLYSVVGSQKSGQPGSGQVQTYSSAELQALFQVGIDVIANPGGGGLNIWTVRCGHNSSSNAAVNGDNYTRMTNYIASTLNAGMGLFLGQVINNDLFDQIRSTELGFCANMLSQGLLGLNSDGSLPYSVICDASNNPQGRTGLGYVQADAQIRYLSINEKFIANIEGGATVVVSKQTTPNGQQ